VSQALADCYINIESINHIITMGISLLDCSSEDGTKTLPMNMVFT